MEKRRSTKKNTFSMYGWVPSLFSWNYHNIVNWPYLNIKSVWKFPFPQILTNRGFIFLIFFTLTIFVIGYLECSYVYLLFIFWLSLLLSCLWLWDPMNGSTLGFPVLHYLSEFAQTPVHWVGDANHLLLCHPLSSSILALKKQLFLSFSIFPLWGYILLTDL